MTIEQVLQTQIGESKKWLDRENDDSTYKRKNPDVKICDLVESKMNEIILAINRTYSILDADRFQHDKTNLYQGLEDSKYSSA